MSVELEQLLATQCEMIAELQADAGWRAEGRDAIIEAPTEPGPDEPLSKIINELVDLIPDEPAADRIKELEETIAEATARLEAYLSETCGMSRPVRIDNSELRALAEVLF
jgi:phosphate uptake regulator